MLYKKCVLKNFAKSQACNIIKTRDSGTGVFL